MSPLRRDENGYEYGPTWESIVDRKIREAMEAGEFDHLSGMGRPLDLDDNPFAGEWRLGFHVLRNARVAPLWIELGQEVQRRQEALAALKRRVVELADAGRPGLRDRLRAALLQQLSELNRAIEEFNLVVPFPWLQKVAVPIEPELRHFDERWPA